MKNWGVFDLSPAGPSGHAELDRWNDLINEKALPVDVAPNLVKAHMEYESGGNPDALGSSGRGCGLMQIDYGTTLVDGTWYYGGPASGGPAKLVPIFPPAFNIEVGVNDFIKFNMAAFPQNLDACIAAYNTGISAVTKALEDGVDLTTITTDPLYIFHVKRAYQWFCANAAPAGDEPEQTPPEGGAV